MIKKIKFIAVATFSAIIFGLTSSAALALNCNQPNLNTKQAIQCGACNSSGQDCGTVTPAGSEKSLNDTIAQIVNILSVVVGIVAVVMMIVGGFRYVTSAGNDQAVKSARNTILYALIGLVIVALAQIIVKFVLHKTTQP